MKERDELLHRITKANPVPPDAELPADVANGQPPLGLLINEGGTPGPETRPQRSASVERRWRGSLVAAGTAAAILIVVAASLVLFRPGQGEVTDPPIDRTLTTIESAPTTVVVSPESWDPILATTTHGVVPPAAECPASSSPEVPGPADQPRPEPRWVGNLAGAFDQAAGRIVYVDVTGETWLFDVCTNTWHQPDLAGTPVPPDELYDAIGQPSGALGQLVYDVDSDVTLALGWGRVSVYDANTWDQRAIELDGVGPLGAVYDPVSGLVITSTGAAGDEWDLRAYDVDTNTWTLLGPVTIDRDTPCCTQIDLLGYSEDLDRLILATHIGERGATLLVDPRSGETTVIMTGTPVVDLGWPGAVYGPADDTVYVSDGQNRLAMCGFDTKSLTWTCSRSPDLPVGYSPFAAAVGDPINDRLILINRVYGDWWSSALDDVWAINIENGNWIQLLAPSDVVTFVEDEDLVLGGNSGPDVTDPPTTTVLPSGSWNRILADTRAKQPPPAAMCPEEANPDTAGPVDQARPGQGPWNNQPAVFDQRTGRIVFVDEPGETWTFDVCTNTWQEMNPGFVPSDPGSWREAFDVSVLHGLLVYDIDSDRTIAFGNEAIAVYDASTNTWTRRDKPPEYDLAWGAAAYDPVSGLVLVQVATGLVAYDTDTDNWTYVGAIHDGDRGGGGALVGHLAGTDRLAFVASEAGYSILVDPRNGGRAALESPPGGVSAGFGALHYSTSSESAFTFGGEGVCRLDPATLEWTCSRGSTTPTQIPSALVYDSINDRLVLINDYCCLWPGTVATDDIWAVNVNTGRWTEILASSSP